MQRIRLNRNLLTELSRCRRSFVMSLFWHGLDNESLQQKGGLQVDDVDLYNNRRNIIYNMDGIANSIAQAYGGIQKIVCDTGDMQGKLDMTYDAIEQGGPAVIVDGALEGGSFVVGFSILIIREDGLWEVYHQSTKSYEITDTKTYKKALSSSFSDAAPLMYVLANSYSDYVARFAVIAASKSYLTPYPDPTTGEIVIDPNEAMYCLDLDLDVESIAEYLGFENPEEEVLEIQRQLCINPFWIPESDMVFSMSKCNDGGIGYPCPYRTFCKQELEDNCPDSVRLHLNGTLANKLIKNDIYTMSQLLELSYEDPTLEQFGSDEILLRELRAYEMSLDEVEAEVRYQFGY